MAEIGISIAVDIGMKLVEAVIAEVKKHKAQVKLANSYVSTYVLSIDSTRLMSDMKIANVLLAKPTVSTADKEEMKHAYDRAEGELGDIKTNLDVYLEGRWHNILKKNRALGKLDEASRRLEVELKRFHDLVSSLHRASPVEELELGAHDFAFLAGYEEERIWITATAFVAEGRLSRQVRDIPKGNRNFLIECKTYDKKDQDAVKIDTVLLNQKLAAADPDVIDGVPKILGFREEKEEEGAGEFQLVMVIPNLPLTGLRTLQQCLLTFPEMPSLNDRVRRCADLAEAVLHVHKLRVVHKNVRPDNILVVSDGASSAPSVTDKLYLVGWQSARNTEDFRTIQAGEKAWHRRIYQHPDRQGVRAGSEYRMEHDIYSLGVCMLEILSWRPLFEEVDGHRKLSRDFEKTFFTLGLNKDGNPRENFKTETEWITSKPKNVKKILLAMANAEVPRLAGARLTGSICDCLNGEVSEPETDGESSDETQVDETGVGVAFAELILGAIRSVAASI